MNARLLGLTLSCLFLWGCATTRGAGEGIPVQITVTDPLGKPIPTAVIRHPEEADRHPVNSVDGSWEESVLYLPDGSELPFTPGLSLILEITAPGFEGRMVQYEVRTRKNVVDIQLQPLVFEEDRLDDPVMSFGRDRPRDGGGVGGPAN
jgi:hypothetical protein